MIEIFTKKDGGAISIFLSLILIPVLAFTGVFIDWSRAELMMSVAASNADMALNTVLTNYDKELSDYYGLMASCQNIDQFMEVSEQYYMKSMNSEIVDQKYFDAVWEDIEEIVGNVEKTATGEEGAWTDDWDDPNAINFLLASKDSSTADISAATTDSNLANPVFMKAQIVEFMKYRAPVGLVESIIQELIGYKEELAEADKDEKLQTQERQVYESESKFMNTLYETYTNILSYEKCSITNELLIAYTDIEPYKIAYEDVHKRMLKNYTGINLASYPQSGFTYKFSTGNFDITAVFNTKDSISKAITDAHNASNTFAQKKTALINVTETNLKNIGIDTDLTKIDTMYRYQFVSQMHTAEYKKAVDEYIAASKEVVKKYNTLVIIDKDEDKKVKGILTGNSITLADSTKTYEEHLDRIKGELENYYKAYISTDDAWKDLTTIETYRKVMKIISESPWIKDSGSATDNDLYKMRDEDKETILGVSVEINGRIGKLQEAIDYLEKLETNATDLIEEYKVYKNGGVDENGNPIAGYDTWKSTAESYDSNYSKNIKDSSLKDDPLYVAQDYINETTLTAFKDKIIEMKTLLQDIQTYLKDVKYFDVPIKDIVTIEQMIEASKSQEAIKGKFTEAEFESAVECKLTKPEKAPEIKNSNSPEFKKDVSSDAYKVYEYVMEVAEFSKKEVNEEDGQKKFDSYDNKGKTNKDSPNVSTGPSITTGDIKSKYEKEHKAEFPSQFTGQASSVDLLAGIIDLVGSFGSGLSTALTDCRDRLFVANYCMEMFSHAAYENEAKYNYMLENSSSYAGIDGLSTMIALQAKLEFDKLVGGDDSEVNKMMTSDDPKITQNKSLTNKMINADNNFAYQRELEYILYGGSNSSNMAKISGEIFTLRYTLNLGPGIVFYWKDPDLTMLSGSISAATLGVVPEPLVRMVLILVLIAAESLNDVELLLAGIPVKFIKTDEKEWVFEFSLLDVVVEEGMEDVASKGKNKKGDLGMFQYSDYMMIFLLLQLTSEDKGKADGVYKRIGDVIQANMREKIINSSDFMLSKSITQFKMDFSITASPLILNLGIYADYADNPNAITQWRTVTGSMARGY